MGFVPTMIGDEGLILPELGRKGAGPALARRRAMGHKPAIAIQRTARMQVSIRQMDVVGAPKRCGVLRVGRMLTSIRFDLPETGGRRALWAVVRRECRRLALGGRAQALLPSSAAEWVIECVK